MAFDIIRGKQVSRDWSIGDVGDFEVPSTDALAKMQTNRQGRAVLGVTSKYLELGYTEIENIPKGAFGHQRWIPLWSKVNTIAAAKDLLNRNRKYAETVYRNLPNNDEPLSSANRKKISVAYKQAASNLQLVSTASKNLAQGLISDVIDAILASTKQALKDLGKGAKESLGVFSKVLFGIALGGGSYLLWKSGALASMKKRIA